MAMTHDPLADRDPLATAPTAEQTAAALESLAAFLAEHEPHDWRQVGGCVWCACGVRLYQGDLPDHKDPGRAGRQATCDHDWDWEFAQGFYGICHKCGAREWGDWGDET